MFVPEPGMNNTVVTPAARATLRLGLCGMTAPETLRPGLVRYTMSLMSKVPPTWLWSPIRPGITQRSPTSSTS